MDYQSLNQFQELVRRLEEKILTVQRQFSQELPTTKAVSDVGELNDVSNADVFAASSHQSVTTALNRNSQMTSPLKNRDDETRKRKLSHQVFYNFSRRLPGGYVQRQNTHLLCNGKYHCFIGLDSAALLLLNWEHIYLFGQIQVSQTGGQPYSDTSPCVVSVFWQRHCRARKWIIR